MLCILYLIEKIILYLIKKFNDNFFQFFVIKVHDNIGKLTFQYQCHASMSNSLKSAIIELYMYRTCRHKKDLKIQLSWDEPEYALKF